jgi:hypothetical protein
MKEGNASKFRNFALFNGESQPPFHSNDEGLLTMFPLQSTKAGYQKFERRLFSTQFYVRNLIFLRYKSQVENWMKLITAF